ncbi:MAG: hypothetical protein RL748_2883 [Pseudomonadota bacterium]|jgi:hypothetical protein
MILLDDIATIHSGYTYRGSLKDANSGNVQIIQMGDAWPDSIGQAWRFPWISLKKMPRHFPLRNGDLIFRARGLNNITVLLENPPGLTICNAPLMFIRMRPRQQVLPAYLQWYLNLAPTQKLIEAGATGEKIRIISSQTMRALPVPLPTMAIQQAIVDEDRQARQFLQEHIEKIEALKTKTADTLLKCAKGEAILSA